MATAKKTTPAVKRAASAKASATTAETAAETPTASTAESNEQSEGLRSRITLLDNGDAGILPNPSATQTVSALLKEAEVLVNVPKQFTLTLDDGRPIVIYAGVQRMPKSMADHWFSKVQGVVEYTPPATV